MTLRPSSRMSQAAPFRPAPFRAAPFLAAPLLAAALFAATSSRATPPAPPREPPPPAQIKTQAPGYYRMMLGDFEITVLSDGTAVRPVDEIMSKPQAIRQSLKRDHLDPSLELSINAFLVNTGSHLVLIDAGAGELFGPHSGGLLVRNLESAGYHPEQIEAVLLTHVHDDHSGGLSVAGRRVFPNALVYADERDPRFWLDPANEAKASDPAQKDRFRRLRVTLEPYVTAGRLRTFDGATQLFPGIRSLPIHGHTPGHTAYMLESQGKKLLVWGDTIHCAEVQFPDPDISIDYDVDRPAAIATRRRLMTEAASGGYLVGSEHISFPGLGYVRAEGAGFRWVPVPYHSGQ